MSKKDYIKIAEVLKYHRERDPSTVDSIAFELALVFKLDNELFDKDRFMKACGATA